MVKKPARRFRCSKSESTRSLPPLIALQCHQALARIEPDNPIHLTNICGFLTNTDPHVRSFAISMLGGFGERARVHGPDVLACIRDTNSGVRSSAAHALGKIGYDTDAAIAALIDVLKEDVEREARRSAAGALGIFGSKAKRAVPALVAAVDAEGGWWIAVDAIARIDGIDALPILIELVDYPEDGVRSTAVRHLGELGPAAKSALPALRRRLADERPYIGKAAAKAIQKIESASSSP